MLSNAYFLAKFRFDTAENEPAKNLQNFRKMHFRKMHFREMHFRVLRPGSRARQASGPTQLGLRKWRPWKRSPELLETLTWFTSARLASHHRQLRVTVEDNEIVRFSDSMSNGFSESNISR